MEDVKGRMLRARLFDRARSILWYNEAMNYQVIIHDAEEGGYWAEVTGMPGCYSQGETLAETKANIREAAMAWMESQVAMALRKVA